MWDASGGGSWGTGEVVDWPDEASSDPWEDSLWDDWELGLGTLVVPMSPVAVGGEGNSEEFGGGLGACRGWGVSRMDPVGSVLLWSEGMVDEDPGEADPWAGGGGMVQASKMASEDADQEGDSDWGVCSGLGQWPRLGGVGGAVGWPWCMGRRSSSLDDSPESNSDDCLGVGFMLVGGVRVQWTRT